MRLILAKSQLVFRSNDVNVKTIEGLGMSKVTDTTGVVNMADNSYIVYFPIIKGQKYKVTLTPESEKPVYKWGITESEPALNSVVNDYASGGFVSIATVQEFEASANGYYAIAISLSRSKVEVIIV